MPDLDSLKIMRQIDRQKMIGRLVSLPNEIKPTLKKAKKIKIPKNWKKLNGIVVAGMGASGIGGDIIQNITAGRSSVPVFVIHDYKLPAFVNKNSLVICISFSGETEETINVADQALKQKTNLFIICKEKSTLGNFAKKNKIKYFNIIAPPPPRYGLIHSVVPILMILEKMKLISNVEENLIQTADALKILVAEINEKQLTNNNIAKEMAKRIFKTTAIPITSPDTSSIGTRFSQQINENAKKHSFSKVLPELSHNFLEALVRKNSHHFIIVKSSFDFPRLEKPFQTIESFLTKKKIPFDVVLLQGKSLLSQIFFGITLLDFVSYYVAILNQENPFYNQNIDLYKKELKK